ncbi:MAG TPA: hypothetical protein VLC79_03030 [Cellvibrio sp.]|nr:hypothetical protein [Cellvibrio sp.]
MKRTTNFNLVRELGLKIQTCRNIDEIKAAIKSYWNAPQNALARKNVDEKKYMRERVEHLFNFESYLQYATKDAKENPYIYDGLKHHLQKTLKENSPISPQIRDGLIYILSNPRPKDKRRTSSSAFYKTEQLAICAWIVMQQKPKDIKVSRTSPDKARHPNNIYLLVAAATDTTASDVIDAIKKHPDWSIKSTANK